MTLEIWNKLLIGSFALLITFAGNALPQLNNPEDSLLYDQKNDTESFLVFKDHQSKPNPRIQAIKAPVSSKEFKTVELIIKEKTPPKVNPAKQVIAKTIAPKETPTLKKAPSTSKSIIVTKIELPEIPKSSKVLESILNKSTEYLDQSYQSPKIDKEQFFFSRPHPEKALDIEENLKPTKQSFISLAQQISEQKSIIQNKLSKIEKDNKKTSGAKESLKIKPSNVANKKHLQIFEESYLGEKSLPVKNAVVNWIGRESKIISHSDIDGKAEIPFNKIISLRYEVHAPGYLPAIGYLLEEQSTKVTLVKEERIPSLVKSLDLKPSHGQPLILGRLNKNFTEGIKGIELDATAIPGASIYYSKTELSLFHSNYKKTGSRGEFVVSAVAPGLNYLLPSMSIENNTPIEWPAYSYSVDNENSIYSLNLLQGKEGIFETRVFDNSSMELPNTATTVQIAGQSDIFIADKDGRFIVSGEYLVKNSVDTVQFLTKGYLKSWAFFSGKEKNFPESVALFDKESIDEILGEHLEQKKNKSVLLGHFSEDHKSSMKLTVFKSNGEIITSDNIFYFNNNHQIDASLKQSVAGSQDFAILGLEDGEYQLLAEDSESGTLSTQIFRVQNNVVSQLNW